MSGVYISGLKMPEEDGVLTLRIWGNGLVESIESYHSWLLSGVKAIPVPDHGRLISADLLKADFTGNFTEAYPTGLVWAMIDDAPTIIPGEERS